MRKIDLHIGDTFMDQMESNGIPRDAVHGAIGYLSLWAINSPRYVNVVIVPDHPTGSLSAAYKNDKGDITYTILGMYNQDSKSYSFHS